MPKKSDKTSTRRKSAQARREEILAAAMIIFGQKGYNAATMDEIAAQCKVSKGTMYNYFENKEALFLELFKQKIAQETPLEDIAASELSGREKMELFVESWFKRFDQKEYFSILVLEFLLAAVHQSDGYFMDYFRKFNELRNDSLCEIYRQWSNETQASDIFEPRDGAMLMHSLLIGLMVQRMLGFENRPMEEYQKVIWKAFFEDCSSCQKLDEAKKLKN